MLRRRVSGRFARFATLHLQQSPFFTVRIGLILRSLCADLYHSDVVCRQGSRIRPFLNRTTKHSEKMKGRLAA